MLIEEAIKQITSQPKYYVGVMPQSTAASIVKRYKQGTLKKSTLTEFLTAFGYELKQEEEWYLKPLIYGKSPLKSALEHLEKQGKIK